jgi:endonuclease/exonuclease/phosphatase (EEP) superfamily protein YafD
MEIVLVVFSVIFIAISFIPLLPSSHWTVRVWEFPRLQIATLLAVLLVVYTLKAISYTLSVLDVVLVLGLAVSLLY